MKHRPPVSGANLTDSEMLDHLRRVTFDYFRHEVNRANGLVRDKTQAGHLRA